MAEVTYVPKKEVKEYKKEMMDALISTSKALKSGNKRGFSISLVGSSKRNLVLRKGNSIYDVDMQLNVAGKELNPGYREDVLEELKKQLPDNWKFDQSTSVITARIPNEKSFDLALIYVGEPIKQISTLVKKKDEPDIFIWNQVPNSDKHRDRLRNIKGSKDWKDVRTEYQKLRSNQWDKLKADKKPSYALYVEAIMNVYNNKE